MECASITKPAPWDRVNIFSKILFTWIWPIYSIGHKKTLAFEDLYCCSKKDVAHRVADRLEKNWSIEEKKQKPFFARALLKTFLPEFVPFLILFAFLECGVRVVQPLFLGRVLRYFENMEDGEVTKDVAIWCAFGIVACSIVYVSLFHISVACVQRIGLRMKIASTTLIYRKSTRLSRSALAKTAVGQIINIVSNDINRFDEVAQFFHSPFVSLIQSGLIMFMLWEYLKWACLTGIAVLILFVPFQGVMGRLFQAVRRKTAILTDRRIRVMSEIISGMRVIKMYTWEIPFAKMVDEHRKSEILRIKHASILKAINLAIYFMSSKIILFACFVTYIFLEGPLRPEAVFVSMAYFNTLRITVTRHFPNSVAAMAESLVTCRRIEDFLKLGEIHKPAESTNGHVNSHEVKDKGIYIKNATARWNKELPMDTFQDINAYVKPGELMVVIGPVGSGKSSLLMALLKELPLESGNIEVNGVMSYASQEAWAFVSTVRDNIIFGSEYDEERYKRVIHVCALERDMEQFPFGDQTLIGDKGVTLSGGQKTRITLARALYREADIYLLDDPLSAVDTHVANHIFKKCIMKHLSEKARILVTHQLQYLQNADRILILKDSKVVALGTYQELREQGVNFSSFVSEKKHEPVDVDKKLLMKKRTVSWTPSIQSNDSGDVNAISEELDLSQNNLNNQNAESEKAPKDNKEQKVVVEGMETGSIKFSVYWDYIKSSRSMFMAFVAFVSMIASQGFSQYSDVWVTEWTKKIHNQNATSPDDDIESKDFFVVIYCIVIGGLFITTLIRTISFFSICMRASVNLHDIIFKRLLQSPISHFDQNPSGRILNRFSKDTGIVDENLPAIAYELQVTTATVLAITIVNTYTNYFMGLPAIFLFVSVLLLRRFYIPSARDIKRLEGIARSPVYSHINNTLTGLSTLRSFGAEKMFIEQFYRLLNSHSSMYFLIITSARGFGVMMDAVCVIYISIITIIAMTSKGEIASYAGLALSYSLTLTGMAQWGVRCSAELESFMTSVERMLEYCRLEPEEQPKIVGNKKNALVYRAPSKSKWPNNGQVQLRDMTMYYDGAPSPVLKNITCVFEGGTKVGIVGRTGAGKSSLISALFRMCRRIEGQIIIDGIDTTELRLAHLRRNISIIPQEPLIFTGTVRYNIDPFDEHSDERLWSVLEEVQLKKTIENLPGGLTDQISEGGSNFSVGQRQLVCLARAILRDNKILLLDEATANVDHRTDQLIQKTIRKRFAHCTVITVAHRLNTIIDSDKILVLDAGSVVEFDSPYELLRKPEGIFSSMVLQTGKRMSKRLIRLASEAHFGQQYFEDNEELYNEENIEDTKDKDFE